MSRGLHIKQSEIDQAHALRAEGKTIAEIEDALKRSAPTVIKMLKMPATEAVTQ